MKIIAPLRVHSEAARIGRAHGSRVVQIAFGNQLEFASKARRKCCNIIGKLRQKRDGAGVENSMNGVQTECIDVKVLEPIKGVLYEELAHFIAFRAVKIQRCAPRSAVMIRKVRAEVGEIVSFRSQMVVDDVERYGEAPRMRGVHQGL